MRDNCVGVKNPVFRLRRPLYGWSRSGNIWEHHLAETLKSIPHKELGGVWNGKDRWKTVDGWPQTFWKFGTKGKPMVLTVYVDDFILSGPGSGDEWPSIREHVRTTEPTIVGRVLGVHHKFNKEGTRTHSEIDMVEYVQQSVAMYNNTNGADKYPLKPNVRYPWYEPSKQEIKELSNVPGAFARNSASLLMKALYCARMVRMDICYTINTLARFVTKWNALCDKQLRHLFCLLANLV